MHKLLSRVKSITVLWSIWSKLFYCFLLLDAFVAFHHLFWESHEVLLGGIENENWCIPGDSSVHIDTLVKVYCDTPFRAGVSKSTNFSGCSIHPSSKTVNLLLFVKQIVYSMLNLLNASKKAFHFRTLFFLFQEKRMNSEMINFLVLLRAGTFNFRPFQVPSIVFVWFEVKGST